MRMLEKYYDAITQRNPDRGSIEAVDVTAAARWWLDGSQSPYWHIRDAFPVVTPPFPVMWMEYSPPKVIETQGQILRRPAQLEYAGCLAFTIDIDKDKGKEVIADDLLRDCVTDVCAALRLPLQWDDQEQKRKNQAALAAGRAARWLTIWKLYGSSRAGDIFEQEMVAAYLDSGGQLIPENAVAFGHSDLVKCLHEEPTAGPKLAPFLFATSLMHAKNVTCEEVSIPEEVKRRRARERKPCLQFRVLEIHPFQSRAVQEAAGGSGIKQALHTVKGHFKDYRAGKGLFGKHKNLYWWDMHYAGDFAHGQVIKDYAIAETVDQVGTLAPTTNTKTTPTRRIHRQP